MKVQELKRHLNKGEVYRRSDLTKWSNAVDRHLDILEADGTLQKLAPGLYYVPKETAFGIAPPDENKVVRSFLKDDRFLITSPNSYSSLGVGTTQLYNTRTVYNHKRHGEFTLGNRKFFFHKKPHFPKKATEEFLLVDLVNNLDSLAEDKNFILQNVLRKALTMDNRKLRHSVMEYGSVKTRKLLSPLFSNDHMSHAVSLPARP
jgi:hypothetical protein